MRGHYKKINLVDLENQRVLAGDLPYSIPFQDFSIEDNDLFRKYKSEIEQDYYVEMYSTMRGKFETNVGLVHKSETSTYYSKTSKGVLSQIFYNLKQSHPIGFSPKEFQDKFLNDHKFMKIYDEWAKKDYEVKLKPSLCKIDKEKPYTIANIQMLSRAKKEELLNN